MSKNEYCVPEDESSFGAELTLIALIVLMFSMLSTIGYLIFQFWS